MPEEFQIHICTVLEGLAEALSGADDIFVYGEGDTFEEAAF